MKDYLLFCIKDCSYKYLVVAISSNYPMSELEDIQADIGRVTCSILFDLTLINGTNNNRYICASVDEGVFNRGSFRVVPKEKISSKVIAISRDLFQKNPHYVDNGTITNALKYLLKNGSCS